MKRSRSSVLSNYVMLVSQNKSKVITGGIVVALISLCLITLSEKKDYQLLPTQGKEILNNPTQFVAAGDKLNGHTIISDNSALVINYKPVELYAPSNGTITTEEKRGCFSFSMPAISSRTTFCRQPGGTLEPILKEADGKYIGAAQRCQAIFSVSGPVSVSMLTSTYKLVDEKTVEAEAYVALNVRKQTLNELQQIQMSNAIPLGEFIFPKSIPPC